MKELTKGSRALGALEKMYRQLNIDKFDGKLVMPIITIQSTPRAYGHVSCGKVWRSQVSEEGQYELNIGAGTLDRPIENTVSTLLHEMVHIYHLQNGIQDCSRGGSYHNRKFKEKAESVGLVIEYDKRIGWSITSPSENLIDYIISQGWSDILIGRSEGIRITGIGGSGKDGAGIDGVEKKPSSTRKYMCPCCGNSVRATKEVRIICADCAELMELA